MPRMSRAAADGRQRDVVADLSLGSRLSAVFLIPVVGAAHGVRAAGRHCAVRAALGQPRRRRPLGTALACLGVRAAALRHHDAAAAGVLRADRQPHARRCIQLFTVAVKIPLLLLCPLLLPPRDVVLGLAAANSAVVRRGRRGRAGAAAPPAGSDPDRRGRVDDRGAPSSPRSSARSPPAGVVALVRLGRAGPARAGPGSQLVVAVVVTAPVTLVGLRLLRVRELDPLFRRLERLVDRRQSSARDTRLT